MNRIQLGQTVMAALLVVGVAACGSDRTVVRRETTTVQREVAPPPPTVRTYESQTTTTTSPGQTVRTTTSTTYPTGTMTVVSPAARTFRLGGDTTVVYTAPPTVDLSSLEGSQVRVEVAPDGSVSRVTRVQTTSTY